MTSYPTIQQGRKIGEMITGQEGYERPRDRYCTRCGARLRRQNHSMLCWQCDTRLYPPILSERTGYRCDWCEREFTPWSYRDQRYCSATCRSCAHKARDRARKLGVT